MDHAALSLELLANILADSTTNNTLFEALCPYEDDANYLFTETEISGDASLLSAFYSIFLISHLLIDEMLVFVHVSCIHDYWLILCSNECRALVYRMPPTLVKEDAVLQTSISLLRAVWQNNHAHVYRIVRESSWPTPVSIAIDKFHRQCLLLLFILILSSPKLTDVACRIFPREVLPRYQSGLRHNSTQRGGAILGSNSHHGERDGPQSEVGRSPRE
jgi:hypothetical protein